MSREEQQQKDKMIKTGFTVNYKCLPYFLSMVIRIFPWSAFVFCYYCIIVLYIKNAFVQKKLCRMSSYILQSCVFSKSQLFGW